MATTKKGDTTTTEVATPKTFNERVTRDTTAVDNTNPSRDTSTRTTARDTARRRTAREDNVRPFTDENDLVNDNPRPNVITEDGEVLDEQTRINREVERNQQESTASSKPGPKYTPNR